jgi:hypothetical protein
LPVTGGEGHARLIAPPGAILASSRLVPVTFLPVAGVPRFVPATFYIAFTLLSGRTAERTVI